MNEAKSPIKFDLGYKQRNRLQKVTLLHNNSYRHHAKRYM